MQPNTWKYFPFPKIAFSENIYFPENILNEPNTALNQEVRCCEFQETNCKEHLVH